MLPFFYGTRHFCKSIWGSRSVLIEIIGSVEILKVLRLPSDELSWVEGNSAYTVSAANPGGLQQQQYMTINATRWLEISSVDHQFNYYYQHHSDIACDADQLSMGLCNQDSTYGGLYPPTASSDIYREVLHISAEPIYLCARSNDWRGRDSFFRIQFRHAYLRERDKQRCNEQTVVHLVLILLSTSVWLLPYLIALIAAVLSYSNGMKIMFSVFVFSACVVCLTPLMLLKSNRYRTRMYFNYFFTRSQAEESRKVIKQRIPLFQAFFFSSVVICVGFSTSYVIYHYTDMDREWRDIMFQVSHASIYSVYPPLISTSAAASLLQLTISVAVSWCVFSLCRSFERFLRDWAWIAMSVALAHILDPHLNPLSREEVIVSAMVMSKLLRLLVVPYDYSLDRLPMKALLSLLPRAVRSFALDRLRVASTANLAVVGGDSGVQQVHMSMDAAVTSLSPAASSSSSSASLKKKSSKSSFRASMQSLENLSSGVANLEDATAASNRPHRPLDDDDDGAPKDGEEDELLSGAMTMDFGLPLNDFIDEVMEGSMCSDEVDMDDMFDELEQSSEEGQGEWVDELSSLPEHSTSIPRYYFAAVTVDSSTAAAAGSKEGHAVGAAFHYRDAVRLSLSSSAHVDAVVSGMEKDDDDDDDDAPMISAGEEEVSVPVHYIGPFCFSNSSFHWIPFATTDKEQYHCLQRAYYCLMSIDITSPDDQRSHSFSAAVLDGFYVHKPIRDDMTLSIFVDPVHEPVHHRNPPLKCMAVDPLRQEVINWISSAATNFGLRAELSLYLQRELGAAFGGASQGWDASDFRLSARDCSPHSMGVYVELQVRTGSRLAAAGPSLFGIAPLLKCARRAFDHCVLWSIKKHFSLLRYRCEDIHLNCDMSLALLRLDGETTRLASDSLVLSSSHSISSCLRFRCPVSSEASADDVLHAHHHCDKVRAVRFVRDAVVRLLDALGLPTWISDLCCHRCFFQAELSFSERGDEDTWLLLVVTSPVLLTSSECSSLQWIVDGSEVVTQNNKHLLLLLGNHYKDSSSSEAIDPLVQSMGTLVAVSYLSYLLLTA